MPKIRYYIVTQTRFVKVSAFNLEDGLALANRVLSGTMKPEDQINVQSSIHEKEIKIEEKY